MKVRQQAHKVLMNRLKQISTKWKSSFLALAPQHQQRIKPKFKTISTVMRWNGIQAKEKICYILMHSIIMQMLDYSHFSKALASISVGQFLFLQVHVHVFFSYVSDKCYQKDFYFFFFCLPSFPYSSTDPYECYRIVVVVVG